MQRTHLPRRLSCKLEPLEERALLAYDFGAPGDGLLSLTFLGDHYPLTETGSARFQQDIQKCRAALQTMEPFATRFGQFAFQSLALGPDLGITGGVNPGADYAVVNHLVAASGLTTDIAVVLVDYAFPGGTGEHQIPVLTNGLGMENVFLHELAHALGTSGDPASDAYNLLWDEYVYIGLAPEPWDHQAHRNIFAGDPAAEAPPHWASLVAPDEYTLGATYPNWYRTYPRGLMNHSGSGRYLNAVSHGLMNEGLDYWASPIADDDAPTAAFATLQEGSQVSGVVPVATVLADNRAVAYAQLWVDGQLARNSYQAPFTLDWTTGAWAAGPHQLQVRAVDTAGNVGVSSSVTVTLIEPGDLTVRTPAPGSTVGSASGTGAFHVALDAWDEALDRVEVWVDDQPARADYEAPYALDLSTSGLAPGAHTIHAVGYAYGTGAARYTTSSPFTFEPLAALVASPAAGSPVAGTVPVTIDVTAGHADRIELTYLTRLGTERTLTLTQGPWVFSWDSTTAPNGDVGLAIRAYRGTGTIWLPTTLVNVRNGYGQIIEPAAGATLSGSVTLTFNAIAHTSRVDLLLDGQPIDHATHAGYIDFNWDSRAASNGPHTLTFRASNGYGWTQDYPVSVTVRNEVGTITLAAPGDGTVVRGQVPVRLAASGGAVISNMTIAIDRVVRGTVTHAPFTWTWDTRTLADGMHRVAVVATRPSGATEKFVVNVAVNNQDAHFTRPSTGATVSGRAVPLALAIDAGAVTSVVFGVDGVTLGTDSRAPFGWSWDSTRIPDGSHRLWAVFRNAQGGSDGTYRTVTVRNDTQAPRLTITGPPADARVGSRLVVTGTATDNRHVSRLELFLDGQSRGVIVPTAPAFRFSIDLTGVVKGRHGFRVKAVDTSGNVGWSATRAIVRI